MKLKTQSTVIFTDEDHTESIADLNETEGPKSNADTESLEPIALHRVARGNFLKRAQSLKPPVQARPPDAFKIVDSFLNDLDSRRRCDEFINLTAMCAAFGRHADRYMALRQSKNFIASLALQQQCVDATLLVTKSGPARGKPTIRAHRRIAVECAKWASAEFGFWYIGKQLETTGQLPEWIEILGMLSDEVEEKANSNAQRYEAYVRQGDPNRLPGLPWQFRRVRGIDRNAAEKIDNHGPDCGTHGIGCLCAV